MKLNMEKSYCTRGLLTLLLLTTLSGCGDDEPEVIKPVARDYSILTAQTNNAAGATWREGDSLTVYTPASTSRYRYLLAGGTGTNTGTFNCQPSSSTFDAEAQCYALTATHNIYSLSSTEGSHMKLAYNLPDVYAAGQLSPTSGSFLMNIPAWGKLTFDSNGRPSTTLNTLTAFLSVDLSTIPDDTRYLLITTHNNILLNGVSIADGASEPLAGNFDCILEDGATLATNKIFKYSDIIRITLDENGLWRTLGRLYIPIAVGHYKRLQVIALEEEYYFDYEWKGTQIAILNNQQFIHDSLIHLSQ